MSHLSAELQQDISIVKGIAMVPTMLEVVCRSTGMGFAAIARVTKDKWIACAVRDEIAFGLEPGGELVIETTICNEIRDSRKAVIIDHVALDPDFAQHHTPLMYGFQSYISVPIILKDGSFFGTLCAIDPNPAELNNTKIIGMFNLFAELIAFHLHSSELVHKSLNELHQVKRQLGVSVDENNQYKFISHHQLQEPLRKISLFSDMLLQSSGEHTEKPRIHYWAAKIDANAKKMALMIRGIADYAESDQLSTQLEVTDLNLVLQRVHTLLQSDLEEQQGTLTYDVLPVIPADEKQIEQLLFHLVHNALKFSRPGVPPVIHVSAQEITEDHPLEDLKKHIALRIADNGRGMEQGQLEQIFGLLTQQTPASTAGLGLGLALCRKIAANHGGHISVTSTPGSGSIFTVLLAAG
jgi:signal transduction histidine kinase